MSKKMAAVLLREGMAEAKAGNPGSAREKLERVTELDPLSELGWLWRAGVSATPEETIVCLRHVLEINPANAQAHKGLEWAQSRMARAAPRPACPFCRTPLATAGSCAQCHAILSLANLDALLDTQDIDIELLYDAIARYQSGLDSRAGDFNTHYCLALAYLNLGQVDDGLRHLQTAHALGLRDPAVPPAIEQLLQRQAVVRAAAVTELEPTGLLEDIFDPLNEAGAVTSGETVTPPEAATAVPEQPNPTPAKRTILVVDDSPTIRKLVALTLEKRGFQVVTAADGLEGLVKTSEVRPDLVLLDITMPKMDGYQLCKLIKGTPEIQCIPVVMLSGKDGFFDKVRGRVAGSTDYITKPFEPDTLHQVVQKYTNPI